MLRIDFNQRFLDHRSILVFVKKLGSISESEFSQLFDDISQLRTVELPNSRTVHLRYTRHISHQFIEWGSFHMHKKLLGILSVAKLLEDDISAIKTAHDSLKKWYGNTPLHSRCFLLGCENISDDERKQGREFVCLNGENIMKEIEQQVADYAMSLFLVLEGKRMDKSLEKPERFTLLKSPLDGDISVDADSRSRKQCIGRMKKYIGDLCLVAGVPEEAIFHYGVAIDLLRSVGDMLWMSGSLEGLCAASLLCRAEHKITSPERPSLQLDVSQLSTAGPVNGTGTDGDDYKTGSVIPLSDDEIVERSEEIFQTYEKHKETKVLAVEARFKYARFFLSKKRYRDVSTALQEVLVTELTFKLSDAEKIQLYSAMAMMYEDIGYMRKAAFFTRKAARHCTSQHLPPQGWTASYNLIRNALDGYKIHFDTKTMAKEKGWPDLKIELMKELIDMSKELQNPNIPIRHISYLIQTMHPHIEESEMQDLINSLEKLASTSQDRFTLVDDIILSNNDVLPPVPLTELPIVRELKVNVLGSHLRPIVNPSSPSPVKTPFIFSNLNKGGRKNKKANPVIRWVEGDVSEVAMQVYNPMPFDIKISKMTLMTEGVPFEAFPSCLALSNDNMSHPFMLLGIPKGPGQLAITGYSVELFGIQSNCPITETILDKHFCLPLIVNVTPKLPLLQFQSSINEVKSYVNSSHRGSSLTLDVALYRGQSISGPIVVENVGKIPVEDLTISLLSTFKTDKINLVKLDHDHLTQSLPIQAAASSHFNLTFHGLLPEALQDGGTLNWSGKLKISYSGGEAWKLGLSRQAAVDIAIKVVPSVHCVNYSVVSVDEGDGEHFELAMDVYNQTNYDVGWRYEMNTGIACPDKTNNLAAGRSVKTTLELEKFDLSGSDHKKTDWETCSEKLLDLVKLRWEILELKVFGLLNLDGLKLNEQLINVVRRSQLTFEMSVNGVKISKGDSVSITASKPVFLTVTICNSNDRNVASSILNIEPFEVDQNGVEKFDVKQKICWLGATTTLVPAIKAKSTTEHTCGFVFLSPGQFYINVRCFERVNTDADQPFRGRAHVIKGESPSNRRSRSSLTDSFTESSLLRQRTQSIPFAQFSYFVMFDVEEDPETVVEDVDGSLDPRMSGKDPHIREKDIQEKDSHTVEQDSPSLKGESEKNVLKADDISLPGKDSFISEEEDSSLQEKDPIISEKDPPEKGPFVPANHLCVTGSVDPDVNERFSQQKNFGAEQDCIRNVQCDDDDTGIPGSNVGFSKAGEVTGVLEDNKCEGGITCSDVEGNMGIKISKGKDTEDSFRFVMDEGHDSTNMDTVESGKEAGEHSSIMPRGTEGNESLEKRTEKACQGLTVEEIEFNFTDNEKHLGGRKLEEIEKNTSEEPPVKTKPTVKERVGLGTNENMSKKLNRTSKTEMHGNESSETKDGNDRTDTSKEDNDDGLNESGGTLVKSPSVKDRITFFSSS